MTRPGTPSIPARCTTGEGQPKDASGLERAQLYRKMKALGIHVGE